VKKTIAVIAVLMVMMLLLAGCGKKAAAYEVLVSDGAGKPVAGAVIQFCSDTECIMGTTDEKGIASFNREAGSYTVHVLKVPEGYAADEGIYKTLETFSDVNVTLKKA
jgi:hypothetical protein